MSSVGFKVFSDFLSTVTSLLITADWEVQNLERHVSISMNRWSYRGADKCLVRPGRKQATATEGFEFHISYL
jgi:hypothetical protein